MFIQLSYETELLSKYAYNYQLSLNNEMNSNSTANTLELLLFW